MIYFFGWLAVVVLGLVWLRGAAGSGCCGNCYQGRKKCDCGKYDE